MEDDTISFKNAKRMIQRKNQVRAAIGNAAWGDRQLGAKDLLSELERQNRSKLNKHIYELAEQQGVSVYDICLGYMPQFRPPTFDISDIIKQSDTFEMRMEVELVPMQLELDKGPGYWKGKYYRLKEHMQELIGNKED